MPRPSFLSTVHFAMCIFSQPVRDVSATQIYAHLQGERQCLVYEMRLSAAADLAMILPLPTPGREEDQVKFVDLSGYPKFFADMQECFVPPASRDFDLMSFSAAAPQTLAVHRVGAFEASFVPALADFARLDARFRLPDAVWRQLPAYRDYGFAVFQLRAGDGRVHPMAFSFPTRERGALYFPTAHVHDGAAHPTAAFDHSLFAQGAAPDQDWEEGGFMPRQRMDFGNAVVADRTRGLVDPDAPLLRRTLKGEYANGDIWLPLAAQ
jgi:hypothetical protein